MSSSVRLQFFGTTSMQFFREYNTLLESSNYITRRNVVKCVSSIDNMRILMNLLRDSNKTIKLEAFHVFKLFVAN
ncbi:putative MO25-like protein At4g17270 isoform X2 [Apium graveolens]|uniref:putative MO25-like protein At4g17270 isoform X2 n=1 Tax=Apium graveolens TaxID=4045 RepID=UPI003D7A74CC